MADERFTVAVDAWVLECKERLLKVARQSIADVIEEAQTAGPSVANPSGGKGGKMPIDTGFLRASGRSNIGSLPYGPSRGMKTEKYPSPDDYRTEGTTSVNLGKLAVGDVYYFGWTAEYAPAIELRYAFLDSAMQNWQAIVSRNAAKLKAGSKS